MGLSFLERNSGCELGIVYAARGLHFLVTLCFFSTVGFGITGLSTRKYVGM